MLCDRGLLYTLLPPAHRAGVWIRYEGGEEGHYLEDMHPTRPLRDPEELPLMTEHSACPVHSGR